MDTRYDELKKRCELVGCHCPPQHEVLGQSANTPMWMRLWFSKTEDHKKKVYEVIMVRRCPKCGFENPRKGDCITFYEGKKVCDCPNSTEGKECTFKIQKETIIIKNDILPNKSR